MDTYFYGLPSINGLKHRTTADPVETTGSFRVDESRCDEPESPL